MGRLIWRRWLPMAAAVLCGVAHIAAGNDEPRFDLLIRGGRLLDGTGNPWFRADVGVIDGRIAAVARLEGREADVVIDAEGKFVTPGFIDLHSLADEDDDPEAGLRSSDPRRRAAPNLVMQGVTTAVVNQDGRAPEPLIGDQLDGLSARSIGLNVALLAGHNTIRAAVMGEDYRRAATPLEVARMGALLREAMQQGAWGLSTGLEYRPGAWSEAAELLTLARVLADFDGVHISHVRAEGSAPIRWEPSRATGSEPPPSLLAAVAEIVEVAERTATRTVLSHLKARGRDMWGASAEIIAQVEAARSRGVRIYGGYYPYTSSFSDGVWPLIPSWVRSQALRQARESGVAADFSAAVRSAMAAPASELSLRRDVAYLIQARGGADQVHVLDHPIAGYSGKTLQTLAEGLGIAAVDMVLKLQLEGDPLVRGGGRIRSFSMSEDDVRAFAGREWIVPVSDIGVHLPEDGPAVHARAYGTFSRHLSRFAIAQGVMSLADAVRQATSLPAQIMGFRDRGLIREGQWADLVVFDPETIADRATFEDPHRFSSGIDHVWINGRPVVQGGRATGELPGQVLLRAD